MTEKLQAGQASLRKELQEELRAELGELWSSEEERRREPRPEAGPFVPFLATEFMTPIPTGTDGSVPRAGAIQRPPLYDVRRGTHTSHSFAAKPLDGGGESDVTCRELAELMEDIERLARLAYPDAAPGMLSYWRKISLSTRLMRTSRQRARTV